MTEIFHLMKEVEYLQDELAILTASSLCPFRIALGNNSLVGEASVNVTQPMMVVEEG